MAKMLLQPCCRVRGCRATLPHGSASITCTIHRAAITPRLRRETQILCGGPQPAVEVSEMARVLLTLLGDWSAAAPRN